MAAGDASTGRAARYFSPHEIERARAYHRPLYRYAVARAVLGVVYLAALSFTPAGEWAAAPVDGLPRWAFALSYPGLILAAGAALLLPLSHWRHRYERRWAFSTQSVGGFLADMGKGLAVSAGLAGLAAVGLVETAAALPTAWPLAVAPAAALLVFALSYLAPVALEPLFNRFRPLEDEDLAAELRALGERATVPVRHVLVADASRRTTKHNAYVSGLAGTRRVVVYDTLLSRGQGDVRAAVAHELSHRRDRHVARGTALGAAGAVAGVALIWLLLRSEAVLDAARAAGASDPRVVPFVMLVAAVAGLVSAPLGNVVSRRWEAAADRAAVGLTGDPQGFARMQRELALANLSDLAPGRVAYTLLFTHPSAPERIAAALSAQGSVTER